jgi:pilus assembly protein FimV
LDALETHVCMLKRRRLPTLVALIFGLAASVDAAALGFGRAPQTAVLGQPLDFAVPLRLDAGEALAADCLSAEVLVGDGRVPPDLVRASIEPTGADATSVRVTTLVAVDEPVVAVTISAGCTVRISRRFLLLADPPADLAAAPLLAAPVLLAEAATPAPAWVNVNDTADPGNVLAAAATPPSSAASVAPLGPPRPSTATAQPGGDGATPSQPLKPASAVPPQRKPAAKAAAPPVARLRLDMVEPVAAANAPPAAAVIDNSAPAAAAVIEEAIAVVAEAASAARASALASSVAAQRISALERDVQSLRAQAQAGRDEATLWRAQAQAAGAEQRTVWPLWVAVLLLAALCGWLAWRMRVLRQADQRSWSRAAEAASATRAAAPANPVTAPIPLINSELELPPLVARPAWPAPVAVPSLDPSPDPASDAAAAKAVVPTASAPGPLLKPGGSDGVAETLAPQVNERTKVFAPNPHFDDGAARDVSIEELLDLEQQAEFFVALGQDDAAIDLLVEHLRSTGGGSPLPYLKLLEIYRRRNEPEAYERTRARFNDRFNAYAPDWDSDLQGGRALDEYPGIVPRLQQAWPRPLDAMAELEALLFRKSRGELFDLPAYREVLFLYALARDLLEREASESAQVDILLPLAEDDMASLLVPLAANGADVPPVDRPDPLFDLDLSAPASGNSLFDDLSGGVRPR